MQHGWTARSLLGFRDVIALSRMLKRFSMPKASCFSPVRTGHDSLFGMPLMPYTVMPTDWQSASKPCRTILRRSASSKEPERRAPSKATELENAKPPSF